MTAEDPVDMHKGKMSAAEVIMTQLHAGGKFDPGPIKFLEDFMELVFL